MNIAEQMPLKAQFKISDGPAPHSLASLIETSSVLLLQAEALLGACRVLIEQSRQAAAGGDDVGAEHRVAQAASVAENIASAIGKPAGKLFSLPVSAGMDVDLFEMFRRRFPDLSRGPLVVLATFIANAGKIISHREICAILNTDSYSTVKVHVSKIRAAFAKEGIGVSISTVRGGYGLSRDAVEKLIAALDLNAAEVEQIARIVPRGDLDVHSASN